jgi:hypothetical protein
VVGELASRRVRQACNIGGEKEFLDAARAEKFINEA